MKKFLPIIIFLSLPVLLVVVVGTVYQIRYSYVEYRATKALDNYFVKCNLPKNEIVDITKDDEKIRAHVLDWELWISKTVTTKKDYANWKKIVKKQGKLLNGEKILNDAYLEDIRNCEISYYATVYSKQIDEENVSYYFNWGGNSILKKEFVETHFAYLPPKSIFDKLVEDWRLAEEY